MKLSALFGPHEGHDAIVWPVHPRQAFTLKCSCGDWFRVTPDELKNNDGKQAFALERCEPIEGATL